MTADLFAQGYEAEKRLPPWQWGFENVRLRGSPYGDRFVVDETPWLKQPLETLTDAAIQETVMMCCAQGGKTVTELVALGWALTHRPGLVMFAAQTRDEAKITAEEKIVPMIEDCAPLAASLPKGKHRNKKTTLRIYFPNATLLIGPANETFFRGKTAPFVFGDECSQWKPGKMAQARARQTRIWNRKAFFASTPLECGAGAPGSEFFESYKRGNRQRYHLAAPCCGELIYLTSDNLEKLFSWDAPAIAPGGERDWSHIRKTVRLVCPECGQKHEQTPENESETWRKMIAGARYVAENPGAPPEIASYAFNVLCLPPSVMPWWKIVQGWLEAKDQEMKGNLAPLREFITLQLSEPWDPRRFLFYTLPDFQDYNPSEEWSEEAFRALTVDCQEHLAEFWVVARAWGRDGSSRLLGFGKLNTEAEIREFQKHWKVPDHLVALDCAYMTYSVYEMCVRNGWAAMRGEDRVDYLHEDGVRRPYSEPVRGDPRSGKVYAGRAFCPVFKWSNPTIKDLTWNLKEGKGAPWAVCDLGPELSEIYAKGVDSERKVEAFDRFGRSVLQWKKRRANHPWDDECMQVVWACMAGLFIFGKNMPENGPEPTENPDSEASLAE